MTIIKTIKTAFILFEGKVTKSPFSVSYRQSIYYIIEEKYSISDVANNATKTTLGNSIYKISIQAIKDPCNRYRCKGLTPGAPSGTRTRGPLIKSQLLYHLS